MDGDSVDIDGDADVDGGGDGLVYLGCFTVPEENPFFTMFSDENLTPEVRASVGCIYGLGGVCVSGGLVPSAMSAMFPPTRALFLCFEQKFTSWYAVPAQPPNKKPTLAPRLPLSFRPFFSPL